MLAIYKPKGKAKEYCDYAINIYTGCTHGCMYCYVPRIIKRFYPDRVFGKDVKPREGIVDALKGQLSSGDYNGKLIYLCFMCDPYPRGVDTKVTRDIIRLLKQAGCHVQILTKSGMSAASDFDLLDKNDWFGVTISGNSDQIDENEPNAAPLSERTLSLFKAKNKGIKTWVSFEPVYDEDIVYSTIKDYECIDMYRIGKLNYYPSNIDWNKFAKTCKALCQRYGRSYYIKEELKKEMGR